MYVVPSRRRSTVALSLLEALEGAARDKRGDDDQSRDECGDGTGPEVLRETLVRDFWRLRSQCLLREASGLMHIDGKMRQSDRTCSLIVRKG
jgi:hypothetical protein